MQLEWETISGSFEFAIGANYKYDIVMLNRNPEIHRLEITSMSDTFDWGRFDIEGDINQAKAAAQAWENEHG
jgi:hypothetical protein